MRFEKGGNILFSIDTKTDTHRERKRERSSKSQMNIDLLVKYVRKRFDLRLAYDYILQK